MGAAGLNVRREPPHERPSARVVRHPVSLGLNLARRSMEEAVDGHGRQRAMGSQGLPTFPLTTLAVPTRLMLAIVSLKMVFPSTTLPSAVPTDSTP